MTRKHFKEIARIVNDNTHANDELSINKITLVKHLCDYMSTINDRFDIDTFVNACNIDKS